MAIRIPSLIINCAYARYAYMKTQIHLVMDERLVKILILLIELTSLSFNLACTPLTVFQKGTSHQQLVRVISPSSIEIVKNLR